MTTYYSDRMVQESLKNGIKELEKWSGQTLTKEQLEEIFGDFEYAEHRDAFKSVLQTGFLIEDSPGHFRVANLTKREADKLDTSDMNLINEVVLEGGYKVKQIVMAKVNGYKDFPLMNFGVRHNQSRELSIAEGMLGSVDVTPRAVITPRPGIVLYELDEFWTKSFVVVLTPEGIFKCDLVMSEPTEKYGTLRPMPDWERREESPLIWMEYGRLIFKKILKLLV